MRWACFEKGNGSATFPDADVELTQVVVGVKVSRIELDRLS